MCVSLLTFKHVSLLTVSSKTQRHVGVILSNAMASRLFRCILQGEINEPKTRFLAPCCQQDEVLVGERRVFA